ncbi:MAG: hypothetical protein K2X00_11180 [Nitrospiraceae bacterium]|nr:hypothetical protein [Nitrospiraceae bacterium]
MRTHSSHETIDIEALLVRAYRERRIDRLPVDTRKVLGAAGPARIGNNTLSRGERVDTSGFGANAAARVNAVRSALAEAGELMLAAHDLVLSLDDYFVEDLRTEDCSFILWTKAGALDAGQWIDVGTGSRDATIQAATIKRDRGPDGEILTVTPLAGIRRRPLHRIVAAPLIVLTGRSGDPPGVSPIEVARKRKVYATGSSRVIGERTEYVTPLDLVVCERGEYAAWHHALTSLAGQLSEGLGYAVAAPSVPARPWEVEGMASAA